MKFGALRSRWFFFFFNGKLFWKKKNKKPSLVLTLELSGYSGTSERSHPAVSHPRGHEKIQLQTHSTYLDIYSCYVLLMEMRCCFFHAVNKSLQIPKMWKIRLLRLRCCFPLKCCAFPQKNYFVFPSAVEKMVLTLSSGYSRFCPAIFSGMPQWPMINSPREFVASSNEQRLSEKVAQQVHTQKSNTK